MKKIFFLSLLMMLFSSAVFAQSWGITTPFTNKIEAAPVEQPGYVDDLGKQEARWTLDLEGLAWIMPDQPARDQAITALIGYGTTYKFSNKLQLVTKYLQFNVEGGEGVTWKHEHLLFGGGARAFVGNEKKQQWQVNFLSGFSSVEGNNGIGKVKGLDVPLFIDLKYYWVFGGNLMIGPQITFGRIPNKCTDPLGTYIECGHGGFTSIALSVQIGLPKDWGQ